MKDCEAVRRLMADGEPDNRVAAHLRECAECRAEAGFVHRLAAAVAAMPRARAPEGFADTVMRELQPRSAHSRPAPRPQRWVLRPWELAWLGAACLALLASLPIALSRLAGWETKSGPLSLAPPGLIAAWGRDLASLWQAAAVPGAAWVQDSVSWLYGASGFALALCLLLSWRPDRSLGRGRAEDAHA